VLQVVVGCSFALLLEEGLSPEFPDQQLVPAGKF
jgi:hypothetical protein